MHFLHSFEITPQKKTDFGVLAAGYAGQLLTYTPDARAACIPVQYVPHALLTRLSPHRVTFLASKPSHASALSLTILDLRTRLEVRRSIYALTHKKT